MTKELAHQLRAAINRVSPFIQQITSAVCPSCEKVCYIDRHGHYNDQDLIYIRILGIELPSYKEDVIDTDPCQFLSGTGCTLEKSVRPFRYNWYFCSALLEYMQQGPQKPYREFIKRFQGIVELRWAMLSHFAGESTKYEQNSKPIFQSPKEERMTDDGIMDKESYKLP